MSLAAGDGRPHVRRWVRELRRRRVPQVAAAYAAAAFVLLQVLDLVMEPLRLPAGSMTAAIVVVVVAFPAALILAWLYGAAPDREPKEPVEPRGASSNGSASDVTTADFDAGAVGAPLPLAATRLVGRREELEQAVALMLGDERLLTLTGPGGSGKTRLALELARDLAGRFTRGAAFIELAPVRAPEAVLPTIVQTLRFSYTPDQPLLAALKDYLRDKSLLLVLDNFEHVLEAAPLVSELLRAAPRLKVIATSRTPLHVQGEHQFPVPPLALPERDTATTAAQIGAYDAIRLFVERAQALAPDFRLTDANAGIVLEICRRLDGLPLALELAAARIRVLTPETLLERLDPRLAVLTGGARDLPARQQTLRDTIAWSYDLLSSSDQRLYECVSAFIGGFGVEAVEAVCAQGPAAATLDALQALVDNSFVKRVAGVGGAPRYSLLETIREFGLEKLEQSGRMAEVRDRHAAYYLDFAEAAEPHIEREDQFHWLRRFDEEHGNLRGALQWLSDGGRSESLLRLAAALWRYWWVHAHANEARAWFEPALTETNVAPVIRAKALVGASNLASFEGDFVRGRRMGEEALRLYREIGDDSGIRMALGSLGKAALLSGEIARAEAMLTQVVEGAGENADRWTLARALNDLGEIARVRDDLESARGCYERSLAIGRRLGTQQSVSTIYNLGMIKFVLDSPEHAARLLSDGLVLARELGDKRGIAHGLEMLAGVWGARGENERAARLLGRSEALREAINVPRELPDAPIHQRAHELARAGADEATFARCFEAGRTMPLDAAIEEALADERTAVAGT